MSTLTPVNPECLPRSKGSLGAGLHTEARHLLVSGRPLLPALEGLPPQRAALLPTPTPAWFWQPQVPHAWLRLTRPCPPSLYTTHTPPELEGPPRPNHTFKLSCLCRSSPRCLQPSSSSHTCHRNTAGPVAPLLTCCRLSPFLAENPGTTSRSWESSHCDGTLGNWAPLPFPPHTWPIPGSQGVCPAHPYNTVHTDPSGTFFHPLSPRLTPHVSYLGLCITSSKKPL